MDVKTALQTRISTNSFSPGEQVDRAAIENLISLASEAPSSFNIQHWRFVVVSDALVKARLQKAAYGQPKIGAAMATIVVLGDTRAHEDLNSALEPSVSAGFMPQAVSDQFVNMATGMYGDERMARDEAIRSGSLAAMALMLAATEVGLATGPMIGFDPQAVRSELGIAARYVPVMLIAIGSASEGNWPRKPRLSLDTILAWETGASLPV